MGNDFFAKLSHGKLVLALVVLSYIFLMFGNGIISLTHPDEVFYIQTAKEMMTHKSWMTPYIFDQPQFEKPIFSYWLFIFALKIFGFTPFAARFAPAFFGIIGVVATYAIAYMLFQNKRLAFLSGVILTTSFIYIALSRAVLTDMIFSILVVLSLGAFYWGYINKEKRSLGVLACFAFSGVAVLAKGLLGFVFPAGIIGAFLIYKKDGAYFKRGSTLLGILIFAAIAIPWHVLMWKLYGYQFIDEYWHNDHLRRIFEAEHMKSNTWYFYLGTMIGGLFPWTLFFLAAIFTAFKNFYRESLQKEKLVFLLFWVSVVFIVVQSAQSKLASYIFPVFPALAIVLARYFENAFGTNADQPAQRSIKIISRIMASAFFLAPFAIIILSKKYSNLIDDMVPIYVFSFLALIIASLLFVFAKKPRVVFAVVCCVTVAVLAIFFLGRGSAEPWVSCRHISEELNAVNRADSTVICSKFYSRGVRFYTDRPIAVMDMNGKGFFSPHPVPMFHNDDQVFAFLNTQDRTFAIVKKSDFENLKRISQGQFSLELIKEIGGKYLLKIEKQ
ncbi:MAG: glycosyltransferase family 39 protein [Candidatus Omnitrophota bacterium]